MRIRISNDRNRHGPYSPRSLVAMIVLAMLLILTPTVLLNLPTSPGGSPHHTGTQRSEPEPLHLVEMRAFDSLHGGKVLERIRKKASLDPVYKQTILRTTKEDIWSLATLSENEKRDMWKRTQALQERLLRSGMEDLK